MLSLDSLRNAITEREAVIKSKQTLASKLLSDAETHADNGDEVQAQRDRDSAERYLEDARVAQQDLENYNLEIQIRSEKVESIDKKIEDLTQEYERDLEHLEKEKVDIGPAVLTGPEPEIARRQLKNMNIGTKEKERQKRYERDLEKLQNEKSNIL